MSLDCIEPQPHAKRDFYYLLLQAGPKIGLDIGNGREITGFLSIFNDQDHVEDC